MLQVLEGWDPKLIQIVKSIPEHVLIDYKLLWRDPVRQWVSQGGRVVLVGDAAHPHLPTSGTGGAQAIEDGATLGVLLRKAGKQNLRLALKAFETLRYVYVYEVRSLLNIS
jgi:2-polyprenyl-6-methoxyphenol hydroxylase-like FAD-dependent oxidoreductase